ncbi:DUF1656 domain-containing protein [Halodesulfovibrio spirochaetisodalis]|uniref:DUF1656 domain-containing protein n=1 Tax=Halodesulfovibrio spirochaetisodalis TaxID=1560234 RepID=UPI0009EEE755|nr:DUF1656 domain-containing protein [Halodesulfovibrio spirochaetisodalis]
MPHELSFIGIYFPPILANFALGLLLALGTAFVLNHLRMSRLLGYPPLVFISLVVLYTCLLSKFVIPA